MLSCSADTALESLPLSSHCLTCCSSCLVERHRSRFTQRSSAAPAAAPFEHLLSAGSVTLPLLSTCNLCDHQHAEDGWHALRDVQILRPYLSTQDASFLDALSFLLRHMFVVATYMALHTTWTVILRIYLIPYDLPGHSNILRSRDENKVLQPAKRFLRRVLSRVSKSPSKWHCQDQSSSLNAVDELFLPPNEDQRTLAQIFNGLTTTKAVHFLPKIPRLRTSLYGYQRESVAAMLEREEPNKTIGDPLYIPVKGMKDETMYFQPASMELLLDRPQLSQTRGGFLCEELGTGKTIMTLALILATLNTLAQPPELNTVEVLTLLALRHFPHVPFNTSRKLANKKGVFKDARQLPTLVEILCHYIRSHPENLDVRSYEDDLEDRQLWRPLMSNAPFYLHVDWDFSREFSNRRQKNSLPRVIYLSAATLIIVPGTLQAQWNSEILKHCSGSIRTLVIKQETDIPPPHKLASDYDIVLIKDTRITAEAKKGTDLSSLNAGYSCRCPSFPHIRIPMCTCLAAQGVSPLLQIRWKRLVRDEGHNAASQATNLNYFLTLISAERRWIVTGTPTTNLLGLNFGSNVENAVGAKTQIQDDMLDALPLMYRLCDDDSRDASATDVDCTDAASEENMDDNLQYPMHIWSSTDRIDLRKLEEMMSSFLGVLPFAADARKFGVLVTDPLFGKGGPLPGAPRVLEQVMQMCMVRHRIAEIEHWVQLPPVKEEIVLLDLDEHAQLTYNALLSFIVINAVDSERKDVDYLFHPSNTAPLASTIENLSHSLFWRVDEDSLDYELPDNIYRAENAIVNAIRRGHPEDDIRLLERAVEHLRKAFGNQQFRDMQHGLELPYRVLHAPQRTRQAWGIVHDPQYTRSNSDSAAPFLMYPSYALELRAVITRQPLAREERLTEHAALVREKNRTLAALVEARKREKRAVRGSGAAKKRRLREEADVERVILGQARRVADSKEKLQEKHEEFRKAQERLKALADADEQGLEHEYPPASVSSSATNTRHVHGCSTPRTALLRMSPLAKMKFGNSTSSKLNYILNEVHKHCSTEKILIFSNQPYNLVHITEGLDLLGVKYLHFMKETGADKQRDQWLTTFETSETYRVFLMELKYGARGLNIVSASRVIFCEPVWHADVESQAIKRVHRIGQTRPVTVKTLAIRSTFEEFMIQRRRDFKGTDSKLPGLAKEMGIRQYLQNPTFLETRPQSTVELDFPLLDLQGRVPLGQDSTDVDESTVTPPQKRQKVRFG